MDGDRLLDSIRDQSGDTEFYLPMPAGYKPGSTRFVIVFGTVMSGLGKGIFASSLAKCLQAMSGVARVRAVSASG